jgi:hypothetical protein
MSERSEHEQRELERLHRQHAAMQAKSAASDRLWDLMRTWAEKTECSERTFKRVQKEVDAISKQIQRGSTAHIDERFTKAVERAVASTLPKQRGATYLQLSKALDQLVKLNTSWFQEAPRTKEEQRAMLHTLRIFLLEIEAGHTTHLVERFQQASRPQHREEGGQHGNKEAGHSDGLS